MDDPRKMLEFYEQQRETYLKVVEKLPKRNPDRLALIEVVKIMTDMLDHLEADLARGIEDRLDDGKEVSPQDQTFLTEWHSRRLTTDEDPQDSPSTASTDGSSQDETQGMESA